MVSPLELNVYARVRPLNEAESCQDGSAGAHSWYSAVDIVDKQSLIFNPARLKAIAPQTRFTTARRRLVYDQEFHFDSVFGPDATQQDVYTDVTQPLVDTAMAGRNASIFAYGATGCGKSYTITGILERLADDLFGRVDQLQDSTEITISMTYLQLYQERLEDLLPRSTGSAVKRTQNLDLRDISPDHPGEVRVPGLCEYTPTSASELYNLCERGNQNRTIAATKANSISSRSHAILSLHIKQRSGQTVTSSCLSIIDLAGSERAQSTQNRGARLAEGASINRSLLALGNVINACCSQQRHIPFRESKLTRLLRHSLTGDCHTAMIVCLSPSFSHFDETRNSLEYGRRAASISRNALYVPVAKPVYSVSEIQTQAKKQALLAVATKLSAKIPNLQLDRRLAVVLGELEKHTVDEITDGLVEVLSESLASTSLTTRRYEKASSQESPLRSPPLHALRVTSPLKRIRSSGKEHVHTTRTSSNSRGIAHQNTKRIHV